jgi:hypothetical protein
MRGEKLREAVREGLAAALLTIETDMVVTGYSEAAFAEALALVPAAKDVG